jgi:hypothetical protein
MLALRRPFLFALIFGCAVSLFTSGRLTLRLAGPASVYWSFVPLIEIAALAVVCRGKLRTISMPQAIDLFFAGFAPWLLWLTGLAAIWSWLPDTQAFAWTQPFWLLIAAPAVLVWSCYIDLRFFRSVLEHRPGRALVCHRLISWPVWLLWFMASSIWPPVASRLGL